MACAALGRELAGDAVVLAAGHSARPLYDALARRGVALAAKEFAVGVRVEHPQPLIDEIQYGRRARHPRLPAAFYQVSAQAGDRGVYSFCMCPGGWVVPASTEPDGLCTNGMSLYRRDSPLANAALAVTVRPADHDGSAARRDRAPAPDRAPGLRARRRPPARARAAGLRIRPRARERRPAALELSAGRRQRRPRGALPPFVALALRGGLAAFGGGCPASSRGSALLVGVETRTSAPLRIERDRERLASPTHPGLYPAGEGDARRSRSHSIRSGALVRVSTPTSASRERKPGSRRSKGRQPDPQRQRRRRRQRRREVRH